MNIQSLLKTMITKFLYIFRAVMIIVKVEITHASYHVRFSVQKSLFEVVLSFLLSKLYVITHELGITLIIQNATFFESFI